MSDSLRALLVHGIFQARILEYVAISVILLNKKGEATCKTDKILVEHLFKKKRTILNLRRSYFLEGRLLCCFLLWK